MSHGVKHFLWRDGRPRWHPSAGLRSKGFKGKDLKDEAGHWLALTEARTAAEELNSAAGVLQPRTALSYQREVGYVYFIFTDTEKVKIGFSKTPGSRAVALSTAMDSKIRSFIVVSATRKDEATLHAAFFKERFKHEWFFASRRILNVAVNSALAGTIVLEANAPRLKPAGPT